MKKMTFPIGRREYTIQFSASPARNNITGSPGLTAHVDDFPDGDPDHGRLRAASSMHVNFWEALSVSERAAFKSAARERTFAAGATLMQEGEQAKHVIVIREGRTNICVYENGQDRVIAERGPGQIIGERAALRVAARSATVVAQELVRALVMTTEAFAAFVSDYPNVLGIVENQIYNRLTQMQASYEQRKPHRFNGENCTVLLTDVVGFGSHARTDEDRRLIRKAILDMTQAILGSLWGECHCEDRGDGLLLIAPPHITTMTVLEWLDRLPLELRRHNHTYADALKVQIRAAVDVGPVVSDGAGVSGMVIIHAARLLDAPVLKEDIRRVNAGLGVIVTDFVYNTAIQQNNDSVESTNYRQIQLNVKETSTKAWIQLTGKTTLVSPRMTADKGAP